MAVPPLGTAADGMPCPTTTDFSLVDQDPADNVTTLYTINGTGQTAEQGAIADGTLIGVGSDNHLLDGFVDPALGCTGSEFTVPSLSSPGLTEPTEATDNLLAAADQKAPVALVPVNDPMTTVGADTDILPNQNPAPGNFSILKTDLYRIGVGQPLLSGGAAADATSYCNGLINAGARVKADAALPAEMNSQNVLGSGMNLSDFMMGRYAASLQLLDCAQFATIPLPGAAAAAVTPSMSPASTAPVTPSATPDTSSSTAATPDTPDTGSSTADTPDTSTTTSPGTAGG